VAFPGAVRGDGQEGVRQDGECGVAMPGVPGADLVVVEPDFVFAGSEAFLDGPACAGDGYELGEPGAVGVIAAVEREFAVVDRAADQVSAIGFDRVGQRPVVAMPLS
jgi:hypothetical protein